MKPKLTAGLLMYRIKNGKPEVLLVHPGGPFWKNKDNGSWSIPKGLINEDEDGKDLLKVAKREFEEETSIQPVGDFKYLTKVHRKDGKVVEVWMFEGDTDVSKIKSNTCFIDWPPRSGKKLEIPEIDRGEFFDLETARYKITDYQIGIIDAFAEVFKKV